MRQYKYFFDFNKEESWLSEMSRKGYKLISARPGDYNFYYTGISYNDIVFRIDYRTFPTQSEFLNYCNLFGDSGWIHVAGTRTSGSQYFVKARPDASEDIFSDNLSRAGRYKRLSYFWLSMATMFIPLCVSIYMTMHFQFGYLTPGLWEMKGGRFIRAFLFETPFVLLRISPILIYVVIILYYLYYTVKSYSLYKKELNNTL